MKGWTRKKKKSTYHLKTRTKLAVFTNIWVRKSLSWGLEHWAWALCTFRLKFTVSAQSGNSPIQEPQITTPVVESQGLAEINWKLLYRDSPITQASRDSHGVGGRKDKFIKLKYNPPWVQFIGTKPRILRAWNLRLIITKRKSTKEAWSN